MYKIVNGRFPKYLADVLLSVVEKTHYLLRLQPDNRLTALNHQNVREDFLLEYSK